MLRSFKGHTGRINSIAVHPTGKLALTVGKDRTLRMWDLMRGKAGGSVKLGKGECSVSLNLKPSELLCVESEVASSSDAFLTSLLSPPFLFLLVSIATKTEGEIIRFSPSGQTFAILSTTTIDLYTKDMSPILTLTNSKRFHDFHFLEIPTTTTVTTEGAEPIVSAGEPREMLFAAVEDGFTRVWERVGGRMGDLGVKEEKWTELVRLGGHGNRLVIFLLTLRVELSWFVEKGGRRK